jgi:hypothetical protein
MSAGSRIRWCALGIALVFWGVAAVSARQQPQGVAMSETFFKNVQILKGIPVDEFMATMGFFSASTGLNCTDCHVEESGGNWAKYADDNNLKRTTRRMIQMVNAINQTNFGRQAVTCYTCHRGGSRPTTVPSIDLLYGTPAPAEPGAAVAQAQGQPPVDQILDRYLRALGGVERLNSLRSFTGKGTYMGYDDAEKSAMEIYAKAPAQRTIVAHPPSGDFTWTFDGNEGWLAAPTTDRPLPITAITGQDLEGLKVESQVLFPTAIKQALTKWRVGIPTEIDGHEVQVVQGNTSKGGTVTLCFDTDSGLLTRLIRIADSPVGPIVTRVDYSDYRDVAGVRMPFKWIVSWLNGRSVFELTSVQPNAQVEATRFARPTSPAASRP